MQTVRRYLNWAFLNNIIILLLLTLLYCIIYLAIFAVSYLLSRFLDKDKTSFLEAFKTFIQIRKTIIFLYFYILSLMVFLMCAALKTF